MDEVEARLTDVFRATFGDEALVLRPEMTADDIPAWDSVSHIQLIFAIEEAFGITLSMKDLEGLADVGALIATVRRHLARAGR
jgi:acyl carrier protein